MVVPERIEQSTSPEYATELQRTSFDDFERRRA